MQILPAITTITPSRWREKLKELKKLKLKEICLFPTCLDQEERKKLYTLLKETSVKRIPFVHLRNDMELWELDYLRKNYQTKVFNVHTRQHQPFLYDYGNYKKLIYVENTYKPFDEKEIREFAGICLDLSHLENDRLMNEDTYQHDIKMIEKYGVGCSHIAAVKPKPVLNENSELRYTSHNLENLSELDYLKKYPLKYIASPIAIELENTIEEQIKVKEHLINLLQAHYK